MGRYLVCLLACALPLKAGPVEDLEAWLKPAPATRPALAYQAFAGASLSAADCGRALALLRADRIAAVKAASGAQWTAKRLTGPGDLQMPFDYRIRGAKPAAGHDLYISMHGGGGAPKAVNDEQWRNQIVLYSPAGIYLAPRAPTDTWNMWHQGHLDAFFDRLIELAVIYLDANPNRVYVMGYSAGGDGVYHMAPRMADRWAAAAMMAGYPNDASPVNLRNIGFAAHVGALDAAYDRNTIAVEYGKQIQKLQDADPGAYKYYVKVHQGRGHWMEREDTVALSWMDDFTRKPHPRKIAWLQDTTVGTNSFPPGGGVVAMRGYPTQFRFHWLALADAKPRLPQPKVTAEIQGQEVRILAANVDSLDVLLNDSLVDLDKPVHVTWGGNTVYAGVAARTIANLRATLEERGDRDLVYGARIRVRRNDRVSVLPRSRAAPRRSLPSTGVFLLVAPANGKGWFGDALGRSLPLRYLRP